MHIIVQTLQTKLDKNDNLHQHKEVLMRWVLFIAALLSSNAQAMAMLGVSESAWSVLEPQERAEIQRTYLIEIFRNDSFGLLIDNQGVDRSTPGSVGGTVLGSAIADAAYIDRAFSGGSYSAKTHLGVALLGGLIGSALNKPAQQRYQFRYTIRLQNGNIINRDVYSTEPFRHTAGLCIILPDITVAPSQELCTLTPETLRSRYLAQTAVQHEKLMPSYHAANGVKQPVGLENPQPDVTQRSDESTVSCKLGSLAPVQTTLKKCNSINGKIIHE